MAIIPETQYPGKITPASADYPFGQARNITLPGDGTGTPWEAALVNDIFGFQQALLEEAGITPTGNPEKATASQYLDAIKEIFSDRVIRATSVSQVEALSLPVGYQVSLSAGGASGIFDVISGDYSTELAADTYNAIYIGLADDPTATTKVAKRRYSDIGIPERFGVDPNGDETENTARLNAMMAFGFTYIYWNGFYPTNGTINVPDTVQVIAGGGMFNAGANCSDSSVDVFSFAASSAGGSVRDLRARHTTKGTGDGWAVESGSRNISFTSCLAANCRRGFALNDVVFVTSLDSCRANSCDTGFYANNAAGSSTCFNLRHCYATDVIRGFDITGCHTVRLDQPIMDVNNAGCVGFIRCGQCSVVNITNAHVEGSSSGTGNLFEVTGSTCDTFTVDGAHVDVSCTAQNDWYIFYGNFPGSVKARLSGFDATKSSNLGLYSVRNNGGDNTVLSLPETSRWSGAFTQRDISGITGNFKVNNPTQHGRRVGGTSGDVIQTGLHGVPTSVQVTVKPPNGGYATVSGAASDYDSSGNFTVRFSKLLDGSADFGNHDFTWSAAKIDT